MYQNPAENNKIIQILHKYSNEAQENQEGGEK